MSAIVFPFLRHSPARAKGRVGLNIILEFVAQALLPVLERDLKDAGTDKSVCATKFKTKS